MADAKKSSIQKKSGCYLLNIKQPERTGKRLKLSFQRLQATIHSTKSDRRVDAAVGLLDISENGAGFFTSELLAKGSAVEMTITDPMLLRVRAVVAWSIPIESGITKPRFPCRSGLQFIYDNDLQKQAVRDFIEKVNSDPMDQHRRVTPPPPVPGSAEAQAAGAPPPAAEAAAATPVAPAAEGAPAPTDASFSTATEAAPAAAPEATAAAPAEAAPAPEATTPPAEGEGGGQSQAA